MGNKYFTQRMNKRIAKQPRYGNAGLTYFARVPSDEEQAVMKLLGTLPREPETFRTKTVFPGVYGLMVKVRRS